LLFFKVVFPFLTDITSLAFAFVRVSCYLVRKSRDGIEGLCEFFLAPIERGADGYAPRAD
jgi:hypothetical protein